MKMAWNTAEADAVFAELAARMTDMTPVMEDIGEIMIESTRQNFAESSSADGIPWAPKSQATMDAYAARGDSVSAAPLIGPSRTLSTTIFSQPSSSSIRWGSNLIQAGVMQFGAAKGEFGTASNGSPIPWGDIPARPFIGVGEEDERQIIEKVEDWLGDADNR